MLVVAEFLAVGIQRYCVERVSNLAEDQKLRGRGPTRDPSSPFLCARATAGVFIETADILLAKRIPTLDSLEGVGTR